jgi:hypothetical protein
MTREQNGITHESNFISSIGNGSITIYSDKNRYRPITAVVKVVVAWSSFHGTQIGTVKAGLTPPHLSSGADPLLGPVVLDQAR